MAEQQQAAEEHLVDVVDKGAGGQIHVRTLRLSERDYLDVRNFYETENGEWKPTRKGIAIPADLIGEVLAAMEKGKTTLAERAGKTG
jgi:hypothetical protein